MLKVKFGGISLKKSINKIMFKNLTSETTITAILYEVDYFLTSTVCYQEGTLYSRNLHTE